MSKFIRTEAGCINLSCVVSARRRYRDKDKVPLLEITYMEGDHVLTTTSWESLDLDAYTAPVIPAEPGYSVVRLYDSMPPEVYTTPIIAWRVESFYAQPICPCGDSPESGVWAIRDPSGKVQIPEGPTYDNVAEFQIEQGKLLKQRRMTAKAAGVSYEQFVANGWTDAQLIEGGYLT